MSVPVLTAILGPEEAALVVGLRRPGSTVHVVRRCADLAEAMSAAAAGLARALIVSSDLERLDREAVRQVNDARVAVVILVHGLDEPAFERAQRLGAQGVLGAGSDAEDVAAAVVDAVERLGSAARPPGRALPPLGEGRQLGRPARESVEEDEARSGTGAGEPIRDALGAMAVEARPLPGEARAESGRPESGPPDIAVAGLAEDAADASEEPAETGTGTETGDELGEGTVWADDLALTPFASDDDGAEDYRPDDPFASAVTDPANVTVDLTDPAEPVLDLTDPADGGTVPDPAPRREPPAYAAGLPMRDPALTPIWAPPGGLLPGVLGHDVPIERGYVEDPAVALGWPAALPSEPVADPRAGVTSPPEESGSVPAPEAPAPSGEARTVEEPTPTAPPPLSRRAHREGSSGAGLHTDPSGPARWRRPRWPGRLRPPGPLAGPPGRTGPVEAGPVPDEDRSGGREGTVEDSSSEPAWLTRDPEPAFGPPTVEEAEPAVGRESDDGSGTEAPGDEGRVAAADVTPLDDPEIWNPLTIWDPAHEDEGRPTVTVRMTDARNRAEPPEAPEPGPGDVRGEGARGEGGRGRMVAVWGPMGAPGRTTVAVTVAAELALEATRPVLLVDADTYAASIAQFLGLLDESAGLAAAARAANQVALDVARLARLAPVLWRELRVLTGLPRPARWPELRPASLEAVWEQARALAGWTVVDCGFGLESDEDVVFDVAAPRRNGATLSAVAEADVVVAVGSADPVGLQRLVRGLQDLRPLLPPTTTLLTVVTRVRASAVGQTPERRIREALERYAGVTDAILVPDDRDACDAALLAGRSLTEEAPRSPARKALAQLAVDLMTAPAPS